MPRQRRTKQQTEETGPRRGDYVLVEDSVVRVWGDGLPDLEPRYRVMRAGRVKLNAVVEVVSPEQYIPRNARAETERTSEFSTVYPLPDDAQERLGGMGASEVGAQSWGDLDDAWAWISGEAPEGGDDLEALAEAWGSGPWPKSPGQRTGRASPRGQQATSSPRGRTAAAAGRRPAWAARPRGPCPSSGRGPRGPWLGSAGRPGAGGHDLEEPGQRGQVRDDAGDAQAPDVAHPQQELRNVDAVGLPVAPSPPRQLPSDVVLVHPPRGRREGLGPQILRRPPPQGRPVGPHVDLGDTVHINLLTVRVTQNLPERAAARNR